MEEQEYEDCRDSRWFTHDSTVHLNGTPRVIGYQVTGTLSLTRNQDGFVMSHGFGTTAEKAEVMAVQNAIKIKQDGLFFFELTDC